MTPPGVIAWLDDPEARLLRQHRRWRRACRRQWRRAAVDLSRRHRQRQHPLRPHPQPVGVVRPAAGCPNVGKHTIALQTGARAGAANGRLRERPLHPLGLGGPWPRWTTSSAAPAATRGPPRGARASAHLQTRWLRVLPGLDRPRRGVRLACPPLQRGRRRAAEDARARAGQAGFGVDQQQVRHGRGDDLNTDQVNLIGRRRGARWEFYMPTQASTNAPSGCRRPPSPSPSAAPAAAGAPAPAVSLPPAGWVTERFKAAVLKSGGWRSPLSLPVPSYVVFRSFQARRQGHCHGVSLCVTPGSLPVWVPGSWALRRR